MSVLDNLWKESSSDVRPVSSLRYVFGVAKSQAVSWAHFHMARTSRVKPMSFGFSRPRMSRCFIMDVNSLLLSSPFPVEEHGIGWGGVGWDDEMRGEG